MYKLIADYCEHDGTMHKGVTVDTFEKHEDALNRKLAIIKENKENRWECAGYEHLEIVSENND